MDNLSGGDPGGPDKQRADQVAALREALSATQAERDALAQEAARSRAVLRGAVEGILVADLATRSFRYANPAICRMFGYTAEEFCCLAVEDIHPDWGLKQVVAAFDAQARGEFLVAPNLPCLRKDGSVFRANISTGRIQYDGLDCNLGIFLDVTDRWEADQELARHREHLEELVEQRTRTLLETEQRLVSAEQLAVLGKFAGAIAHEIRTPLTVIENAAYYLERRVTTDDEAVHKQIQRLHRQVLRTTEIIDSILSLSRPDPPEKETLDVGPLVGAALESAGLPASLEIRWRPPTTPLRVYADPNQLTMALDNLIRNAAQAMAGEGRLTLAAEQVHRDGQPGVQIAVADTGPGIPAEDLGSIFEPLFTTKSFGVGFGLPIVKLILDRHNGTVDVTSAPGQGATFTLWLPE